MRNIETLPDFFNVSPGVTASLQLPLGLTYDAVKIECGGTNIIPAQHVERIEVKADGKLIYEFARGAGQVSEWNEYYRRKSSGRKFIDLWFARKELANLQNQRLFGLGTAGLSSLVVNVKLAANAPADISLKATAIKSERAPTGALVLVREFPVTFNATGEQEIANLPFSKAASIGCIHLHHATANSIRKLRVQLNQKDVFEIDAEPNAEFQMQYGRHDEANGANNNYFRADFMMEGDVSQALIKTDSITDFRLKPTLANAGLVSVMVEYIGALGSV